ncbi:MAG: polysaccharide biosynthesis tyrosine autokinase [Anaerolineaceae bacterium]|nr:polysaccharide biosynthesis tyrosine autokinase [Anaerolineaceae bacterium]
MQNQTENVYGDLIQLDVRKYFSIALHWAWLILLITIVSGLVTFLISKQITPIYSATTSILINEAPSNQTTDYNSILTSERLARTYAQMMVKQPILSEVSQILELNIDIKELYESINVIPVRDTQLIDITVENIDPLQAALIANTLVYVFSDEIQTMQAERFASSKQNLITQISEIEIQIQEADLELNSTTNAASRDQITAKISQLQGLYSNLLLSYEQVRLSEAETISTISQIEPAQPPIEPIRPKVLINTIVAAILGMAISIAGLFLYETLDDTIKTPDEVEKQLNLSVLGVITHHQNNHASIPITELEPRSPITEAFRTLRTNVQYTSIDQPLQTILVTSPLPKEGKTTILINLGIVLAQSGLKVTIIDGDMRRPNLHRKIGSRNHIGLSSVFVRPGVIFDGAIQNTRIDNLQIITAGRLPPNPSELLGSKKMHNILEKIKEESDIVLIDTPPVLAVTDATVLSPQVDGVLVIMQPGKTKFDAAKQTIEQLRRVGANIIGVVLNDVKVKRSKYGYYYNRGYQIYQTDYYSAEKSIPQNQSKRK